MTPSTRTCWKVVARKKSDDGQNLNGSSYQIVVATSIKLLFLVACVCFCASVARGDDPGSLAQQIQMARSITETDRQRTVVQGAQFSDQEVAAFVPIYREYRGRVADVNRKIVAMLKDYSDHYDSLSDERAQTLTREWLAIERQRVELKSDYAKKFGKVLPAVKVARVLQIENRLDLLQMIGASAVIPLVKP